MTLPTQLLESIATTSGFDKEAFQQVHASVEQVTSIRLNPAKIQSTDHFNFQSVLSPVPWAKWGYYLSQRPSFTFDPLFHAGCYYVQEASSMFLEFALRQLTDLTAPLKVLDLSAAPGGKSTHLQSLISRDSLLVANEVIRARAGLLKDNIIKWGAQKVVVTNNDPKDLARLKGYFDVMVVDAPCSGSGLFRKDPEAIHEWSLGNVELCSQRQQRILADAWPTLKNGGLLIYSTCSYSKEEDEEIMDWISESLMAKNEDLTPPEKWGIVATESVKGNTGYRFWPYNLKGEGFFLSCFRKEGGTESSIQTKSRSMQVSKADLAVISKWVQTDGINFIRHESTVYAWPGSLSQDMDILLANLKVVYSGVRVGELMRDKLVPDHALALSNGLLKDPARVPLEYDDAIRYLQRKDIRAEAGDKGWKLASYNNFPLGWMNVLPNRINNYYPKELRILKETN